MGQILQKNICNLKKILFKKKTLQIKVLNIEIWFEMNIKRKREFKFLLDFSQKNKIINGSIKSLQFNYIIFGLINNTKCVYYKILKQKQIKMFKKRLINKDSNNISLNDNQNNNEGQKKIIKTGIDLRKDIQQMQEIISTKKQKQTHNNNNHEQKYQQNDRQQHSVFKTKKINKFTSHILKNLPTKTLQKQSNILPINKNQSQKANQNIPVKLAPQPQSTQTLNKQLVRPILSNYGLLDKNHFKSTSNANQQVIEAGQGKTHQQALMDYYIKKKMQQMTKSSNPNPNQSSSNIHSSHKQPQAWQQVLQIQKQYLTQQQKIKEYSMQQIQKKLQKLAQQSIKLEIQKRANYLKDLLQNEYERMQYASKKQLKIMKQQKQRIQKQLNSKYRDSGRRNFIQNIKNQLI